MSSDLIASLAEEIERLWREPRPTAARVRQLARAVLLEASDSTSATDFLGLPPANGSPRDGILRRSLLAARAVAWVAVHFAPARADAEWLVAAALLADAGRLRPKRPIGRADDPGHPALGAALAAGLTDSAVCLPRLIARHHERADGTGFPAGLTAARLAFDDRLLSAAARFAELVEGDPVDGTRRLHDEGRRRLFDAELTANFAWSVTGELPSAAGFGRAAPRPWALTDDGRRRLRFDAAHSAPARPHFGAVRSSAPFGRG